MSVKNMIGAGSISLATLTGPGDVFLQTMHFEDLVNEIVDNINTGSSLRHERDDETISKLAENEKLIKELEAKKKEQEAKEKKEIEMRESEEKKLKELEEVKKKKKEELGHIMESIAKIEDEKKKMEKTLDDLEQDDKEESDIKKSKDDVNNTDKEKK